MKNTYLKKRKKSKHISLDERIKIEVGLETGQSIRKIAQKLNRSVSSVSLEIKKGKYNGKYKALITDNLAIYSVYVNFEL